MSEYDDYFTDDIFLDEQTLAVLDHEEQKYLTLTQAIQSGPPPSKRQKTKHASTPESETPTTEDIPVPPKRPEYLPEIALHWDGSYGVQTKQIPVPSADLSQGRALDPGVAGKRITNPIVDRTSCAPAIPPQRVLPPTTSRNNRSPSQTRPPQAQRPNSHGNTSRKLSSSGSTANVSRPLIHSYELHGISPNVPPHELQEQVQELQQKLEQVNKENQKIQAALKEATGVRMAKEGEVTILRQGIAKSAKEHAAQLAKFKADKEEVEAKQIRLQKEMREEVERMKTQVIFKQHEQEAARRPLPSSSRSKKHSKDPSSTFMPSQMRTSTYLDSPVAPRRAHVEGTPIPRLVYEDSRDARKGKKNNVLPGFRNAFDDITPLRPSQKRSPGKQREVPIRGLQFGVDLPNLGSPSRAPPTEALDINMNDATEFHSEHETLYIPDADGDIEMTQEAVLQGEGANDEQLDGAESDVDIIEEVHSIEPFSWTAELNRVVLTHSLPARGSLTIHLLLRAPAAASMPPELSKVYSAACTRVLEVIANTSQIDDWAYSVACVSQSLVLMIPILRITNSFPPLVALLSLLAVLVYSIPNFGSLLLSPPPVAPDSDSKILAVLCRIIQDQREKAKTIPQDDLIAEVITLLEALCFNADDETVNKLASIARNRQFLLSLLHTNQPHWLLVRVSRLFVVMASHRKLCRALLSMPDSEISPEEKPPESARIQLVERLCVLLVDVNQKDAEFKDLKSSILTFFALLATSQPEVHDHLLTSTTVIPSIVLFLSQLTAAFWEDDEELISASPNEITSAIRTLNQTLFFMHYIVFTSVSILNLRQKLHVPQHRIFHGLMHLFIVTFGRLSYSEAPEWIDREGRTELVSLTDMARDILDHVVDGPEADRTWQVYQTEPDIHDDTDEEEMEAKLLGERI